MSYKKEIAKRIAARIEKSAKEHGRIRGYKNVTTDQFVSDRVDREGLNIYGIKTDKTLQEHKMLDRMQEDYVTFIKNREPMRVPKHQEVWRQFSIYFSQLENGLKEVMAMTPAEQEEILISCLPPNTNIGHPLYRTQNKKNFIKLVRFFESKHLKGFKIPVGKGNMKCPIRQGIYAAYLTVDEIFNIIKFCITHRIYYPFVLFYRTQGGSGKTKHRSVFGGNIVMKLIGLLSAAASEFAFEADKPWNAEEYTDEWVTKKIHHEGGIPIVGQVPWSEMFESIRVRMPPVERYEEGILKEKKLRVSQVDEAWIQEHFHYDIKAGQYTVNVIGEDFPGYDQGIIYEDLIDLEHVPFWGWIFKYVLDACKYSDVWTGNKRIKDIFFKSGHPFTSTFGSYLHRTILYNVRDWLRAKGIDAHILAASTLSDDSIVWVINMTVKDVNEYLKEFGLRVKIDDSYDYVRDLIVGYLKVLVGVVFNDDQIAYVGDPVSRYYGMAHSERDIEQDITKEEEYRADLRGVYKITGDIELDSFLSKLASYGKYGIPLMRTVLENVKDTDLGRAAILAISSLDPAQVFDLYRKDVPFGFNPRVLASLQVQNLLPTAI